MVKKDLAVISTCGDNGSCSSPGSTHWETLWCVCVGVSGGGGGGSSSSGSCDGAGIIF